MKRGPYVENKGKNCAVCDAPATRKGHCDTHGKRLKAHGDPMKIFIAEKGKRGVCKKHGKPIHGLGMCNTEYRLAWVRRWVGREANLTEALK